MKPVLALGAGVLFLLTPVSILAHTYTCPTSVRSRLSDGYFRFECVFVASSNTAVAGSGWSGTTNCTGGIIGDCFCEPFCAIAEGDTERVIVQGNLDDPEQPGAVETYFSLCGGGGSFHRVTEIFPHSRAGVDDAPSASLRFGNQPNPFALQTTFHYTLPASGLVSLRIYDTNGRLRAAPLNEERPAGTGSCTWRLAGNLELAPGVYIAHLAAGKFASTRRIVITR